MKTHKYKRILIKLSGEALSNNNANNNYAPISAAAINNYVEEISNIHKIGTQIGIVIGGGNFYRGINTKDTGIKQLSGDKMGMLATIMNALALKDVLEHHNIEAKVKTAVYIPEFADIFHREKAIKHLTKNRICIFAGGTSNPLFTTDTAAALRSVEIEANLLIKATNVDGIYDKNPHTNNDAIMFNNISYDECIQRDLKVMDSSAFLLCKQNNMPIIVTNINKKGNLLKIITGEQIGTLVNIN